MKLRKMRAVYEDERGGIIDIVEDIKIDSVTLITSKKGARRGDHYHKKSVQYTFVLKGTLELLTQMPGGKIETFSFYSPDGKSHFNCSRRFRVSRFDKGP